MMTNLDNQPFFISLKQAAHRNNCNQTVDFRDFEQLLEKQQRDFKDHIEERFFSDLTGHKFFYFLKTAKDELYRIHLNHSDAIKAGDVHFYRFWEKMIDETRRFINICIDTLKFQRKIPPHMASDVQPLAFPPCNWTAKRADLMEIIVALYHTDVIRLLDGKTPPFAVFAKEIGSVFGITFSNPQSEMDRILDRKKNQTPFLNRMVGVLKKKCDDSLS